MKNTKDNFYHYDLKKKYVKLNLAYDEHQLNVHAFNRKMVFLKQHGQDLINMTDEDLLIYGSYFDMLELK